MNIEDLPIPEEMKEAIRSDMTRQKMQMDSFQHDVQRLFEELNKDHLLTLRHVFSHLAHADNGLYAAYLEGVAAASLRHRFNVCPSCGVNHDEEFIEAAKTVTVSDGEPVEGGEQPSLFAQEQQAMIDRQASEDADNKYRTFLQTCREYNVRIPEGVQGNTAEPYKTPVVCMGCGHEYVSLEDRMLADPGVKGCPGCMHKAKWG